MSVWAWVSIGLGCVLLIAAGVVGGIFGIRAYRKRALLRLLVRMQAIDAASSALTEGAQRLSSADDDELHAFADDPDSVERRVLHEVSLRARHLAEELDHVALPAHLVALAETMADAAFVISREAGRVTDDDEGERALERLGDMDLETVAAYVEKAHRVVVEACEEFGLEETAVYGGGLYL